MAHPAITDIVSKATFLERKSRDFAGAIGSVTSAIDSSGAAFEGFLESRPGVAWGLFSILYFAWASLISYHKQLWFDELVSYSVDHLPTWKDAWHALAIGVDANPPLFHFVNRLLLGVFGDTNFIERASSILGFWAMSLCVYTIVRRNHSAAAGWVAAIIPGCSGAAYYATEARPYGMVLGFVSLAIICWLNLVESTPIRRWWLAGLTLSLACAISSHYYSVFAVAPFIGAELTRAAKRLKIDWAVLGAVLASYFPLIIFYRAGLMTAANQYTGSTDKASLLSPIDFWSLVLSPVSASILLAVGLALGWNWLAGRNISSAFRMAPSNSLLIGVWFCALPVVVVFAARYVTHAYEHRYAITAVIGAAVLIGVGFDSLRSAIPGAAGLAILALILPVTADAVIGRNRPRGRHSDYNWAQAAAVRPNLPVVYAGPLEFVQGWYNAPSQELKQRIAGLVDVGEARRRTGSTTADLGIVNLVPAMPVPATGYHPFVAQRKPFYLVYQPAIITSWVTRKLIEDGASLELQGLFGADELYLVVWRPAN